MAEPKDRLTDRDIEYLKEKGYSDNDISKVAKQRQRPKGSELRASLKQKKKIPAVAEPTDPYLSRNEFKPGFYEQNAGKITPEGLYGTASGKKMFEADIVDPDTSMMQNMAEGGSVRGQKNIQVKKKVFKGVF